MNVRADTWSWSAPDEEGIRTCAQPQVAKSTLKGARLRRGSRRDDAMFASLPQAWRALLLEWLRGDGDVRRWSTLLKIAGEDRWLLADTLCHALLVGGWIELDERRRHNGHWEKYALRWCDRAALLRGLGCDDPDAVAAELSTLVPQPFLDPRLPALADTLVGKPAPQHLRRLQLLHRLDAWLAARQRGTRRQFAYFARDHTKALSDSEWRWLDESLGLPELGIDAHLPGVWLRAPLTLHLAGGRLDLAALSEPLALTPAALAAVVSVEGQVAHWRVLENRTSFEQAASAHGDRDGVLWVPGFPAAWWREAIEALLRKAPAPALIACDPDPAGIRIALKVAEVWMAQTIPWRSWAMSVRRLQSLGATVALNDYDRAELERLQATSIPDDNLSGLVAAMARLGIKGEQEGFDLAADHD